MIENTYNGPQMTYRLLNATDRSYGSPRTLYNRLPRQFCFEQTEALPGFLNVKRTVKRCRRARVTPRFYKLEI